MDDKSTIKKNIDGPPILKGEVGKIAEKAQGYWTRQRYYKNDQALGIHATNIFNRFPESND